MKRLVDFIKESTLVESETSALITFNFDTLEGAEDILKSLEGREGCEIEDKKLTVTVTSDNVSKLNSVVDILQQYSDTIRNSAKRSSDEAYAQKTKAFAENVAKLNDKIDEIENPEEE